MRLHFDGYAFDDGRGRGGDDGDGDYDDDWAEDSDSDDDDQVPIGWPPIQTWRRLWQSHYFDYGTGAYCYYHAWLRQPATAPLGSYVGQ